VLDAGLRLTGAGVLLDSATYSPRAVMVPPFLKSLQERVAGLWVVTDSKDSNKAYPHEGTR